MSNDKKIIKGNIFNKKKKNQKLSIKTKIFYSKDGTVKAGKTITGNIFSKKK